MKAFLAQYKDLDALATEIDADTSSVAAFREKEEQRLYDLYAPPVMKARNEPNIIKSSKTSSEPFVKELLVLWKRHKGTNIQDTILTEEHEREVSHEMEQEAQIQRPPKANPQKPAVDRCLYSFIKTGSQEDFNKFSLAYDRIAKSTSIRQVTGIPPWSRIRITKDFANTVNKPASGYFDNFLRPVNWILTSKLERLPVQLLIISPHEAEHTIRTIQLPDSQVRIYTYEPRVTKIMGSVDYGTKPLSPILEKWKTLEKGLRLELHFFAGQLYFHKYKHYKKYRKYLDGMENESTEQTRTFLRSWIAIRRMGQDFLQTHVGMVASGRTIKEEDF